MKATRFFKWMLAVPLLLLQDAAAVCPPPEPMGTAFTYQGFLTCKNMGNQTVIVDGAIDLKFELFDCDVAGLQKGPTLLFTELDAIEVDAGSFTVALDFTVGFPNVYNGDKRWLEITILTPTPTACAGDPMEEIVLSPRQELTPVPYALFDGDWNITENAPDMFAIPPGNVGIGINVPTEKLDVAGNIHASGTISSGSSITINGTANTINSIGNLDLQTGAISRVFLDNTTGNVGNVGIGTNAPTAKLDVNGQIRIRHGTPGVNDVLTAVNASGLATWAAAPSDGDWMRNELSGWMFPKNFGDDVGIGTPTPEAKLHVNENLSVNGAIAAKVTFNNNGVSDISTKGLVVDSIPISGNRKGAQVAIRATAGVNSPLRNQDGDVVARLAFARAFSTSGTDFIAVYGTSTPRQIKNNFNATANALGGRFVVSAPTGLVLVGTGIDFWIGGSYNEVVGTFDQAPAPGKGAIAAVIGRDNNTGTAQSFAGYFDGKVLITDLPPGGTDIVTVDSSGLLHKQAGGGAGATVPIGAVIDWYRPVLPGDHSHPAGTVGPLHFDLPNGYQICDGSPITVGRYAGTNTPDLRDRFVRGIATTGAMGVPGGSDSHDHGVPIPIHTHPISDHIHSITMGFSNNNKTHSNSGCAVNCTTTMARGNHIHATTVGSCNPPCDSGENLGVGVLSTEDSNVPAYVGLLKIMRIF